jgi:hypothetical protein
MDAEIEAKVGFACFQNQDLVFRVGAQAICENTAGTPAANDNVIIVLFLHKALSVKGMVMCLFS